jgi:hypothetical protein
MYVELLAVDGLPYKKGRWRHDEAINIVVVDDQLLTTTEYCK